MCPIIHFPGLAFADSAFHPDLTREELTPAKMHTFKHPEGRTTIEFRFRQDILNTPLFRGWYSQLERTVVHPTKALSATYLMTESHRLGQLVGLPHPFRPYCLRCEVGSALTVESRNSLLKSKAK